VAVGQYCWHFSFTPDGAKFPLACGPLERGDLPLALGVVTYPPSAGSIVGR
jgi:hypothetical protein